jgi:hypothetical protein
VAGDDGKLVAAFKDSYDTSPRKLSDDTKLGLVGRSATISADLIDGITTQRGLPIGKPLLPVAGAGRALTAFVKLRTRIRQSRVGRWLGRRF